MMSHRGSPTMRTRSCEAAHDGRRVDPMAVCAWWDDVPAKHVPNADAPHALQQTDEMRTVRPESGDASRMLPRLYAPCSASLDLPWFPGPLNYSIAHPTPHCGGHGVSGDGCPSGIQGNEALTSGNSASGGIPRVLLGTI